MRVLSGYIVKLAHWIGMDGAIAYSSAARVFQAFAGVVSIFVIASFLTGEEQGFYYTFGSILAIQVFFELGFTGIMTQYVAHEVAYLEFDDNFGVHGDGHYVSRLSYLIKFCLKWYAVIATLFFIIVFIIGIVYFNKFDTTNGTVSWKSPWLLLSLSTAISLFQSPFTAILNGLGRVKEMCQVGFFQQIAIPISQWLLFACGAKLYVVGISSLLGVLIWWVYVFKNRLWLYFYNLMRVSITDRISYLKEIFPYQWKIALSWISGYFIFQLFNPVLFATEGAVVAGQMGMTISVLSAIQAFSLSWQNTKVPLYSRFIELGKYDELDAVFDKTVKQMAEVCFFLLTILFIFVFILRITYFQLGETVLSDRFLDFFPMLLMAIPVFVNQFIASWATYLRCHKQEPFLVNSIVIGGLCCLSTFVLGNLYGLYGITIGYCCIMVFISLPWAHGIFANKKKKWHN